MQTELNRVKGKPRYQELKGVGTEEEQAAEAWEYARKWNDSVIDDIFGGLLQSTVECRSCQHPSNCFDKFLDLSIPIPSRSSCTITDCLASFTEVESLGRQDGYRCEKCKCNVAATKQLQIYHLPNILMLHLKRFSSSGVLGRFSSLSKNNGSVRLTLKGLDLAPFCNPLGIKNGKSTLYDLIGVSNHSGSLGGGHYTAVCQNFKVSVPSPLHKARHLAAPLTYSQP
jgi:ubiquitin C-terminal hydrolase